MRKFIVKLLVVLCSSVFIFNAMYSTTYAAEAGVYKQEGIQNLYTALFNRAPDIGGLNFWSNALSSGINPLTTISQGFLTSPEGDKSNFNGSMEQFVTAFYINTFGRAPDSAGLDFWTKALSSLPPGVSLDVITTIITGTSAVGSPPDTDGGAAVATFSDVPVDDPSFEAIEAFAKAGIISGIGDGLFGFDKELTRQQLAVIFVKILGIDVTGMGKDLEFSDVESISDYARDAVAAAVALGLFQGYPDGTFKPKGPVTDKNLDTLMARFNKTIDQVDELFEELLEELGFKPPSSPEPVNPTPVNPEPVNPTPVNPEPVNPTPVNPEPVNPTPVNPEPVNPTPVNPEPVNPTPVNPEPVNPTPVNPEPVNPTPVNPEPVNPDPNQPDPNQPDPNQPDPNQPDPNQPDPNQPNQPDPNQPDPNQPNQPDPNQPGPNQPN